jgi:AcrR family transcriptional regulator
MTDLPPARRQRALRIDAVRNRSLLMDTAVAAIREQGTDVSLREVARRAGVGLGTLYRHFPTREALLEAVLGERFNYLTNRAATLGDTLPAREALTTWIDEYFADAAEYRGLTAALMTTLADAGSPLHASCVAMRGAVTGLLGRAQASGELRPDVDGTDLFALVNAVGWIADQGSTLARRRDHLINLVMDGLASQAGQNVPRRLSR